MSVITVAIIIVAATLAAVVRYAFHRDPREALYAAQCAAVVELRGVFEQLTPDQAQVLVVVEFDLIRLAKSLAEERKDG